MTTATQALAAYGVGARLDRPGLRHAAARAILDTFAAAAAGRGESSQKLARAWARTAVGAPGAPAARDWMSGDALFAAEAAFVNGVTAHALDFDDVSMSMSGHPSALLVPVAVAVAEATGAPVGELLAAYTVGLHTDIAVAAGFDLADHYDRGWHASATIGTLGAVAAAARLLKLDEAQTAHALGIGVSMASGTKQNFGTMTKALHIGLAASNAVRAAQLAALGFDASPGALDGPLGFYSLYGVAGDGASRVEAALAEPESASLASLSVKRYPCCYQTHRAIDAALDLHQRLSEQHAAAVPAEEIADVVVHVNPGSDNSLIYPYAETPTQARFCMRYVVAAALVDGGIGFDTFTPERVASADVQHLMKRVRIEHEVVPPYGAEAYELDYAAVAVTTSSGVCVNETCTAPRGSAERPLTDDELVAKADDCFAAARMTPLSRSLLALLDSPSPSTSAVVDRLREMDVACDPRDGTTSA